MITRRPTHPQLAQALMQARGRARRCLEPVTVASPTRGTAPRTWKQPFGCGCRVKALRVVLCKLKVKRAFRRSCTKRGQFLERRRRTMEFCEFALDIAEERNQAKEQEADHYLV